jgi:hypothetical protein
MDNFKSPEKPAEQGAEEPIRIDDIDKPMEGGGEPQRGISRKPLSLGSSTAFGVPAVGVKGDVVSSDRITGVKTFFTKLHGGALDFLDGQINEWLRSNPGIKVKKTNTVSGIVAGKTAEPSIIVTVWY